MVVFKPRSKMYETWAGDFHVVAVRMACRIGPMDVQVRLEDRGSCRYDQELFEGLCILRSPRACVDCSKRAK